jgi:hypothetical protein
MFKLTRIALEAIRRSPAIKSELARALSCSEGTINRYIRENADSLTKAAALKVISEETGLTEKEILEKNFASPDESHDFAIVEMSFHFKFKKG